MTLESDAKRTWTFSRDVGLAMINIDATSTKKEPKPEAHEISPADVIDPKVGNESAAALMMFDIRHFLALNLARKTGFVNVTRKTGDGMSHRFDVPLIQGVYSFLGIALRGENVESATVDLEVGQIEVIPPPSGLTEVIRMNVKYVITTLLTDGTTRTPVTADYHYEAEVLQSEEDTNPK